jgi:hypothetical protein
MKRLVLVGSAVAVLIGATPVYAINDGRVPARDCANSLSAVGTPGGASNPGLAISPVGAPAATNNPSDGKSQAVDVHTITQPPCNG